MGREEEFINNLPLSCKNYGVMYKIRPILHAGWWFAI